MPNPIFKDVPRLSPKLGEDRVIICPDCEGEGVNLLKKTVCEECKGDGAIRLPTRAERSVQDKIVTLREAEISNLRKCTNAAEIALTPCGVCGKLMQNHACLGDRPLCPMSEPSGTVFYPSIVTPLSTPAPPRSQSHP